MTIGHKSKHRNARFLFNGPLREERCSGYLSTYPAIRGATSPNHNKKTKKNTRTNHKNPNKKKPPTPKKKAQHAWGQVRHGLRRQWAIGKKIHSGGKRVKESKHTVGSPCARKRKEGNQKNSETRKDGSF